MPRLNGRAAQVLAVYRLMDRGGPEKRIGQDLKQNGLVNSRTKNQVKADAQDMKKSSEMIRHTRYRENSADLIR